MKYPQAAWRGPVPNQGGAMSGHTMGVFHIMEGTLAGTDQWFHNPAAQVSAHFGVGKDGTVYQWVDTDTVAWAEADYNGTAVSIEHEGVSGDSLTVAQEAADTGLINWIERQYGQLNWYGHGQLGIRGGNHPDCPGNPILAQMPNIVMAARAALPTPIPPTPEPPMDLDNQAFIRWCYYFLLGRNADPGGFAGWDKFLASGGSRNDMMDSFINSAEGKAWLNADRKLKGYPPI